jgi:hypothetical protein
LTDYAALLRLLVANEVEFILVGGLAANAHGVIYNTRDVDIVYRRTPENLERLSRALASHSPYLRGAPPDLPFRLDPPTLRAGLNFTLTTALGSLDLLGEIAGGGTYTELIHHAAPVELFGVQCQCIDLDTLIRVKRAAGRPQDLVTVAQLEALREERQKRESS